MERIKFVALTLILTLLLISCAPSGAVLDYQVLPFTARFALSTNGIQLSGILTAGSFTDTPRDVSISFESPDSLSGITVTRKGGKVHTSLDNISVSSDGVRWLAIAELFSLSGAVSSAKATTLGGIECTLVSLTSDKGEKYSVYIDKSGAPLRICGNLFEKPFVLDIISFKQDVNQ